MTREKELKSFILSSFSPTELIEFINDDLEQPSVCFLIPERAPMNEVVSSAVGALARRGVIDSSFFARLADARPQKAARVRTLAAKWVTLPPIRRVNGFFKTVREESRFFGGPRTKVTYKPIDLEGEAFVVIDEPTGDGVSGVAAVMRPSEYSNMGELLNDLFIKCLKDTFSSMAYGEDWVLLEGDIISEELTYPSPRHSYADLESLIKTERGWSPAILPWEWLAGDKQLAKDRMQSRTPFDASVEPGRYYRVLDLREVAKLESEPFLGLVTNWKCHFQRHPKGLGSVVSDILPASAVQDHKATYMKIMYAGQDYEWYLGNVLCDSRPSYPRAYICSRELPADN